jgi:hypothetical protein
MYNTNNNNNITVLYTENEYLYIYASVNVIKEIRDEFIKNILILKFFIHFCIFHSSKYKFREIYFFLLVKFTFILIDIIFFYNYEEDMKYNLLY